MRTIKPSDVKKDELFFVFFFCAILPFSITRIYASVASKIKEAVQKPIRNPL